MKKIFLSAAACCLAVSLLVGCGAGNTATQRDAGTLMYEKGLALVAQADGMAENESYIRLMSASDDLLALALKMGAGDYETPKSVYKISLTDEQADASIAAITDAQLDESLKNDLINRFIASATAQLSARGGANALAAASIVTTADTFVCQGLDRSVIYLYIFDGDYSAAVSFTPGSDSTARASCGFLDNSVLGVIDGAEGLKAFMQENSYLADCTIETVEAQ